MPSQSNFFSVLSAPYYLKSTSKEGKSWSVQITNRTNPERSSLCYSIHLPVLPPTYVQPSPTASSYWTPYSVTDQDAHQKSTYNWLYETSREFESAATCCCARSSEGTI